MGADTARLDDARGLDASDPLRELSNEFALPHDGRGNRLVYLCGHSLGPLPLAARTVVDEELDDWARLAVGGHERARRPWIAYVEQLHPDLERLCGARPGEVVAMNSLTVNLHLMLASFYRPAGRRTRILIESGAFPSDRHAVASQIAWHGLDPRTELIELAPPPGRSLLEPAAISEVLRTRGEEIALVLWPGVQYLTGQAFDLAAIARAARSAGAVAGFDLAHAIGNLPLQLHDAGADFAVWCGYKYLNGGPGALAGCFVHERHGTDPLIPRLAGWWGHEAATRFAMGPQFRAAHGAQGWQVSNPPILSSAPLVASLAIFRRAGLERLRVKSLALTSYLESLLRALPVSLVTPSDPSARGCQLSIRLDGPAGRGRTVLQMLQTAGIACDWREPDILRVAPAPLYNRFEDALRFAQSLAEALHVAP